MTLEELLTHLFDLLDKAEPEGRPSIIDQQTLKAIIMYLDILETTINNQTQENQQ
jgi:hypothetical protein